jgi:oxygen-independent coproporphyrinogen-3 oxidase
VTPGIYIHIPFCRSKCNYCHFVSVPYSRATSVRYEKALIKELASFNPVSPESEIDSVYFGGGTPSIVPAGYIAGLLETCRRRFRIAGDCEISMEANPGTLSLEKLRILRNSGVNRVSLGAQTFNDRELMSIGRRHDSETILKSLSRLRECGFTNVNLDLMLGLPGQTAETWRNTLRSVERLGIPHLSVYMLDLDDQCPLQGMVASGSVQLPEEDLISDLYLETLEFLSGCGWAQYEISNFARPGYACRHNLKYWQRKPVHGFGLGSHSFDGQTRCANVSGMDDYLDSMNSGKNPVHWREPVTREQTLSESIFLGLRLTRGVDWGQLQETYGRERLILYEPGMRELSQRALIEWNDSAVRLTPSGMLLSNEVFQLFI